MPMHTLTIPNYLPPAKNKLMFGSVWNRIRLTKECKDMVKVYSLQQDIPKATGKRRVSIKHILGKRNHIRDDDSSSFAIRDALTTAGLIIDDSNQWAEFSPLEQEKGKERATVITLEDI